MSAKPKVLFTDCEGPLVFIDLAREAAKKIDIHTPSVRTDGQLFYDTLSVYNAYRSETGGPNQPGDTLAFFVPHLLSHSISDWHLRQYATETQIAPGVREYIDNLNRDWEVYVVSTAFNHLLDHVGLELNIGENQIHCSFVSLDALSLLISRSAVKRTISVEEEFCQNIEKIEERIQLFKQGVPLPELFQKGNGLTTMAQAFDELYFSDLPKLGFPVFEMSTIVNGSRKAEFVRQKALEKGIDLEDVVYIGDSITDDQALKMVRESGGLAIALNGDEFAIRNANVAVALRDRRDLQPLLDAWTNNGMEGVKSFVENGMPYAIGKERSMGTEAQRLTCRFVDSSNVAEIVEIHKVFREKSREGAVPLI